MRRFAESLYGRRAAYRAACRALEKPLARNIFEVAGIDDGVARLARYVRAVTNL